MNGGRRYMPRPRRKARLMGTARDYSYPIYESSLVSPASAFYWDGCEFVGCGEGSVAHNFTPERFLELVTNRISEEGDFVRPKIGDKVVRGPDWIWGDQDRNSIYGIVDGVDNSKKFNVRVKWEDKHGKTVDYNNYTFTKEVRELHYYKEEIESPKSSKSSINLKPKEHGNKTSHIIKVCRPSANVRKGQRITGSSLQGRRSKTTTCRRQISNHTITV